MKPQKILEQLALVIFLLFAIMITYSFAAKKPEVIKYNAQYLDRAISINVQWQSASPVIFVRIFAGNEQKEVKVDEYDNKRNPYGYTGEVTVVVNVEPAFFQESVGYTIQLEDDVRQKSELITGKVEITPSVAREREDDRFGRDKTGILPGGQRDTKGGDIVDKLIGVMERHDAPPYLHELKLNRISESSVSVTTKATDDKGLAKITFKVLDAKGAISQEEGLTDLGGKLWQGTSKAFTLTPGNYKVVVQAIDTAGNYSKEQSESFKVSGVMPLHGSLTVNIMPEAAVKAGAQWRLAGGEWQNSGAAVSGLPAGAHNIDFKDVAGFIKPSIKSISIQAGQTTAETASYGIEDSKTGSLNVIITPQEVSALGAKWSIDGTNWHEAGKKIDIAVGTYTVRFSEVKGWGTPASQTVEIKAKGITPAQGNYKKEQGSLTVTIIPQAVIEQGAQWRVDNGAWQPSGALVSNLSAGQHTIEFKEAAGWGRPQNQTVTVVAERVAEVKGIYQPVPQEGSIKGTIEPAGAVSAGAQWRVDNGAWQPSGAVVSNLSAGQHTIEFKEAAGWGRPQNQTVTVVAERVAEVKGIYQQQAGSLNVIITPQEVSALGAKWSIDGTNWHEAGKKIDIAIGTYTVRFSEVKGWGTPASQTVEIKAKGITPAQGNYKKEQGSPDNIALNINGRGYPSPLESDRGWGGGSYPWEMVDGKRTYPEWAHGLAFCGGTGNWCGQACGWRQVTIDFGEPKTFNRVVVWHHGLEHVPNSYKIQYWDGINWLDVFSTTSGRSYLLYPAESWSTPTENTFNPVTSSKVKFLLNNCGIVHGWIYEIEVYKREQ